MAPQVRRSSEISGAAREPTTDMAINGEGNNVAELNPGFYELGRNHQRRGQGVTINKKLSKLRARGIPLDLHFPQQFGEVCGRHASVFKSEVTVCIRQEAPLRVMKRKDMDNVFPGTTAAIWNFLRISVGDKGYVMAQVERHYNVQRSRRRPSDGAPEDWPWLIENLWTDEKFKKRSETNSRNRGQQEMKSLVGTKSIVQIAYEQEHAAALQGEVLRLTEANNQLRDELQSQREELTSQRRTVEEQSLDMERLVDQKLEERMRAYFARMTNSACVIPSSTSTCATDNQGDPN
ncbi:ATP synthase subunit-like protein [Panicum miliaceum]|uniref:ATP synthase subunit-like protein n=1 Tax=Panicum miliaceum TaxID=4540 RepID=A0A3L6RD67_PANMI|nr:ATP synthase subunit-like protein [Panicum miliaceum]